MSASLTGMDGILYLLDYGCNDRSGEAGALEMLQASEG